MTEQLNTASMTESFVDVSSQSSGTTNPSVIQSDDETCIIGEIDVGEYFDDVFGEQPMFVETIADQNAEGGESSSFGNINNRSNTDDLEMVHTSVVMSTKNDRQSAMCEVIPYLLRNAAVQANVNIANCLKRKHPTGENRKHVAKYRLVERTNTNNNKLSSLKDFGIQVPSRFYQIFLQDRHFLTDDNFILRLPADPTVYAILTNYSKQKFINPEVLDIVLETFDMALPKWCLYRIEQLQYKTIIKKFPALRICQIYGLPHLIRFITCLPRLFNKMKKYPLIFVRNVSMFINGFLNYMIEANININFNKDYDNVMPDYYRMTYWDKRTK